MSLTVPTGLHPRGFVGSPVRVRGVDTESLVPYLGVGPTAHVLRVRLNRRGQGLVLHSREHSRDPRPSPRGRRGREGYSSAPPVRVEDGSHERSEGPSDGKGLPRWKSSRVWWDTVSITTTRPGSPSPVSPVSVLRWEGGVSSLPQTVGEIRVSVFVCESAVSCSCRQGIGVPSVLSSVHRRPAGPSRSRWPYFLSN